MFSEDENTFSKDGSTFYTNDLDFFNELIIPLTNIETGIIIDGSITIDDKRSVLVKKEIPCKSKEETAKTYLKVMEVRELTPKEENLASRVRLLLKRIFEGIYNKKYYKIIYSTLFLIQSGYYFRKENFLMAFIELSFAYLFLGPVKFPKEVKKLLTAPKRRQEATEYLEAKHILNDSLSIDNDEDIKLYIKRI